MKTEKRKSYECPKTVEINVELEQMMAASGDVTVGGWGDGGSLGGGEADEDLSSCRKTNDLWSND